MAACSLPGVKTVQASTMIMEEKEPSDDSGEEQTNYTGLGIALGVALGAAVGAITDNIGFWVSIGLALGVAVGAGYSALSKK